MGWLAKLFNAVSKEEREGICLGQSAYWEVSPPKNFISFLRALRSLLPEGAVVYLEGGYLRGKLKAFLLERSVAEVSHVAMGTIWPRPVVFHIPATPENLSDLAGVSQRYVGPEVAVHFHVYKDNRVLLEWYDAFFKDPLYLSKDIPEEKLKRFCEDLSVQYKRCKEGQPAG